jgi:hypothetical protein
MGALHPSSRHHLLFSQSPPLEQVGRRLHFCSGTDFSQHHVFESLRMRLFYNRECRMIGC